MFLKTQKISFWVTHHNISKERILYERWRSSAFWEVQCFGVQRFDPALLRNCVLPDGGPMCSDEFSFVNHLFSVEPSQLYMSKYRTIVGVQ